jgi:fructosamine-3-kinase
VSPDWTGIADAIGAATQQPFVADSVQAVGGGSIHAAWRIGDGRREFFVKTGEPQTNAMFIAEAAGLQALAATGTVRTPAIVVGGASDSTAFLVLEALDLVPLDRESGARLGEALARMHRITGDSYGWPGDNFIGATPQLNAAHPSWAHFFGDRRLRPQLQRALANGMDKALVNKGIGILERLGGIFLEYRPQPSLLHGDLWSGNAGALADGTPALFDPACYWGDRETDIAMAELFGGFPTSFFAAYRAAWPLDSDYERRKPLYNLYHVLNHYNLFGGAYLGQAQRMIERLLAEMRR